MSQEAPISPAPFYKAAQPNHANPAEYLLFGLKFMINWHEINFHRLPVITTECWQLLSQALWNENLSLGRLFLNSEFLKRIINVVIL